MKKLILAVCTLCLATTITAQRRAYHLEGNELKTGMPIVFKAGTDVLLPGSDSALQEVKSYLTDKTAITQLRIECHLAAGGDEAMNQELTRKRALAIAQWLVKNGVDGNRLVAVAFGSTKPVASNDTPTGKAEDTRAVFVNAALLKRPIGGLPIDGGGQVACMPCTQGGRINFYFLVNSI